MNLREKYRPSTLDDLVDCEDFVNSAKTWDLESCPNNMLFVGSPGIGKTSAAYALTKDMMGEYFDPMNFIVTNGSDDRGIDYIRQLKSLSKQKGLGVARRVILLDEADSFTAPAQKALRQIMEESHQSTIFILTANDIGPIHDAIRDRCLTYHFKPIHYNSEQAMERLGTIIDQEGMPEEWLEVLPNLIKFTNGSLRQVMDVIDSLPTKRL